MNTTINTQGNLDTYNHNRGLKGVKKCGWLCRTLNNISEVVAYIPIVGTALSRELTTAAELVSAVETLFSRSGSANHTNAEDYEPTDFELSILEPWQSQRLTPFYENLSIELKNVFNQKNIILQVAGANAILNKMCIVITYFAQYETTGLSNEAIYMRNALIQQLFEPLYAIIESSFASSNLITFTSNISVNSENVNQFNNLLNPTANFNTTCENYKENSRVVLGNLIPIKIKLPKKTVSVPNFQNTSEVSAQLPGKTFSNKSLLLLIGSVAVFLYFSNKKKNE